MVNFSKFQRVSRLGFVTAPSFNGGQPNFARCFADSIGGHKKLSNNTSKFLVMVSVILAVNIFLVVILVTVMAKLFNFIIAGRQLVKRFALRYRTVVWLSCL